MSLTTEQAEARVKAHLLEGVEARQRVLTECSSQIVSVASVITNCFKRGGKLLICGNGGSAADCQHFAAEFVCQLSSDFKRKALPALALTTDSSFLTAYSNDYNFEGVFSRQVEALGKDGDILFGISTSGNSKNVILAFEQAKRQNIITIALCGMTGRLPELADHTISIPCVNAQIVQELHLTVEHLLCALVERSL